MTPRARLEFGHVLISGEAPPGIRPLPAQHGPPTRKPGHGGGHGHGRGHGRGLTAAQTLAAFSAISTTGRPEESAPPAPLSYKQTVLADNPISYWKLDETAGTTAANTATSGATYDGTYTNSPTLGVTPLISTGHAATFAAASSQWVNVSHPAISSGKLSVEIWVKTTQSGASTPMLFSQDSGATPGRLFQLRLSTTGKTEWINFTVDGNTAGTADGTVTINNGATHHIVCTYDGTTQLIYVDGAQDGAGGTFAGGVASGTLSVAIAARHSGTVGSFLSGTVDEAAIYDSILTASQVLAHYNARTR